MQGAGATLARTLLEAGPLNRVGIVYNFKSRPARDLAHALHAKLSPDHTCWVLATNKEARGREAASSSDLIIAVGGDGTVLRAARIAVPSGVPILGVNMGRVGFMSEVQGAEALEKVPAYLKSEERIEERAMLDVEAMPADGNRTRSATFLALNDAVLARGGVVRVVEVEARVNGTLVTRYRADGVIVATATGSTGYALASGGPILYPESRQLVLVPVSAHLSLSSPVLVPPDGAVELRLISESQALLSIDGQTDHPVKTGDVMTVKRSDKVTRLLRAAPPSSFYASLPSRLHRPPS